MQPSPAMAAAQAATQEDRQKMMELLHITELRPGKNGSNPQAPNYANYDEANANPYPKLPDPLVLKNGKKVTTAGMWWNQRRPEIVEDFDREVYGRVPKVTPKVKWEVVSTAKASNGDVPIVTKTLVGHVDNSSYPAITVDIQVSLTTPANATGPVPVIMQFGFAGGFGAGQAAPEGLCPERPAPLVRPERRGADCPSGRSARRRAQPGPLEPPAAEWGSPARVAVPPGPPGSSRCSPKAGATPSSTPAAFRPITARA